MAGSAAPDTPLVAVRETESGRVSFVLPIDAREMIASGAYTRAVDVASPSKPAPAVRTAHQESKVAVELLDDKGAPTSTVVQAFAVDARDMVASGAYRYVPQTELAAPAAVADEPERETVLPSLEQLAAVLETVTDADVLLEMEARDERPESKPLYEARFSELAAALTRQ